MALVRQVNKVQLDNRVQLASQDLRDRLVLLVLLVILDR